MMTQNLDFSPEQEDIIESVRETNGIPGVAAAIVKDGEIVAIDGFGHRNRDAQLPMTAHTVSPLCSLTKSFTGVAVMQLVESGKIWLDEPVGSYLPKFRVANTEASRKMTPRILLCHKSGMGRTGHQSRMFTEPQPYKNRGELVSQLAEVQLQTPPNAAFSYCNEGYATLGHLVETVSDIPLEDYFQAHIFDTVDMKRTYPRFSQWQSDTDRSHGYEKKEGDYEETQLPENYNIYLSTGGICSTAYDFAKYLIATMDYANSPLLSSGSLDAMHTVSMPYGDTGWGYGFGWAIAWNAGRKIVSHGGGLSGIATYALMVPAEQLGVVVLTNLGGGEARQIAEQLANSVSGTPLLRPTPEDPLPFNTRYTLPSADTLAQYVGTYTRVYQDEEVQITIEMAVDKLTVQYPDEEATPYIAIGTDVFMDHHWGAIIHFVRNAEGRVNSLLQGGNLFRRSG
jgi:CubicO group peptidase (beta-lactamase class C family)